MKKDIVWIDFTPEEIKQFADRPIFIVGAPRSGTTLMRSVIDAHPNICCPPCETFLFVHLNPIFNGAIWQDHYKQLPYTRLVLIKWLRRYILDLFANLTAKTSKKRWAEKTPSHVKYMKFINELFPDAQFIHMIRKGYDVARSLKHVKWGSKNIILNTYSWASHVSAGYQFGRSLPANRYIEIRYEDLISAPEQTLGRLCRFLDEPYHRQMLEFHKPENNSWGLNLSPFTKGGTSSKKYNNLNLFEKALFRISALYFLRNKKLRHSLLS